MNHAREERLALCALMTELGPEAPTLCAGWTTADLAAHLALRDRRPDAAAGILVSPLAGYTERVRKDYLRRPYAELIGLVRSGPPNWSPARPFDAAVNTVEYFVHHEDIRRAQPGWEPRELDPRLEEQLWRRLRMARLVLRNVPVEITLVHPDQRMLRITKGGQQARVHGAPGELALWALGRTSAAGVSLTGEADAVTQLSEGHWRL